MKKIIVKDRQLLFFLREYPEDYIIVFNDCGPSAIKKAEHGTAVTSLSLLDKVIYKDVEYSVFYIIMSELNKHII